MPYTIPCYAMPYTIPYYAMQVRYIAGYGIWHGMVYIMVYSTVQCNIAHSNTVQYSNMGTVYTSFTVQFSMGTVYSTVLYYSTVSLQHQYCTTVQYHCSTHRCSILKKILFSMTKARMNFKSTHSSTTTVLRAKMKISVDPHRHRQHHGMYLSVIFFFFLSLFFKNHDFGECRFRRGVFKWTEWTDFLSGRTEWTEVDLQMESFFSRGKKIFFQGEKKFSRGKKNFQG